MALNLQNLGLIGQRARQKLIVRQDSLFFRDFNMQIIQSSGVPVGNYEEGSMLMNKVDAKLYMPVNIAAFATPSELYLKFDSNSKDYSGNKILTTEDGVTYVAGKYQKAINFDGVNDKLTIDASMGMAFNTDWTISFWIYPTGTNYIIERYKDGNEYFYMKVDAGTVFLLWNNGAGESMTGVPVDLNEWNFVHFTHDNSANFIKKTTWSATSSFEASHAAGKDLPNIPFTTEDFELGRSQVAGSFGDAYKLDDLKIWSSYRENNAGSTFPPTNSAQPLFFVDRSNISATNWFAYSGVFYEAA